MKPSTLMKVSNVFCTIFTILALAGSLLLVIAFLALPSVLDGMGLNLESLLSDGITNDSEALEFIIAGGATMVAYIGGAVLVLIFFPFFLLPCIASVVGWRMLRGYKGAWDHPTALKKKKTDSILKIVISIILIVYSAVVTLGTIPVIFGAVLLYGGGVLLPAVLALKSESVE